MLEGLEDLLLDTGSWHYLLVLLQISLIIGTVFERPFRFLVKLGG
jgi:hypothetical protein